MRYFRHFLPFFFLLFACSGGGDGGAVQQTLPPPTGGSGGSAKNDADGDTILDADDNCPATANLDQADNDYDGEGNVCDAAYGKDANGDGVLDSTIERVTGDLATSITINGSGFSTKTNAAPLFWWKADMGELPSTLGRKPAWDDTTGINNFSTAIVAPGSQQAAFNDHGGNSGIALSRVNFDSAQLYIYRKTYEDFDITKDEAIKARVILNAGTLVVGDVIAGVDSGATGTVYRVDPAPAHITYMTHEIFFSNSSGSVAQDPPLDFIKGEQMTSNTGADITDVQVFRTFNFKTHEVFIQKYRPAK